MGIYTVCILQIYIACIYMYYRIGNEFGALVLDIVC